MADQSVELEQVGAAEAAQAPQVADGRLITMLVDRARSEGLQLTGGGGLLQQLTKRVLGSALEGEITDRLGCDKREAAGRNSGNSRSGTRSKTVLTDVGPVGIKVPRDLTGTCGPQIVKKRQRRLTGACEMVLCLSAKGLTHGGIAARLAEVYGAEVSKQTISTITGKAMDGMAEWRSRPLGRVYPVLFVEAVNVRIRDGQAANRPVCVALAVTVEGRRDIPGIRAGDGGEGAKYWLHVFTELKNRGLQDVLMLVCDGLEGLPEAVETVRPRTIVQTCVIHLLRNGFRCAGRQDWDKIAKKPNGDVVAVLQRIAKAGLHRAGRGRGHSPLHRVPGGMGRQVSGDRPAPGGRLGGVRALPRLRCRDPQGHLPDQRDRERERTDPQGRPRSRALPERAGRHEARLYGADAVGPDGQGPQALDHALEDPAERLPDPLRRPAHPGHSLTEQQPKPAVKLTLPCDQAVGESLGRTAVRSPGELGTSTRSSEFDLKSLASLTAMPYPTSIRHRP